MIWGYALIWKREYMTRDPDPLMAKLKFLVDYGLKETGIGLGDAERWHSPDALVSVLIGASVIGAARPNNSWDYPTYLVLGLLALFVSGLQSRHRESAPGRYPYGNLHSLLSGVLSVGLFGAALVLFFLALVIHAIN
jgi:hypothetical protein